VCANSSSSLENHHQKRQISSSFFALTLKALKNHPILCQGIKKMMMMCLCDSCIFLLPHSWFFVDGFLKEEQKKIKQK
jgi:hypothetical protein